MSYIHPELVVSPKSKITNLNVLHDGGKNGWSLAEMRWGAKNAIGLRWNGGDGHPHASQLGNPQSRGIPTWFVLPDDISKLIVDARSLAGKLKLS